MKTRLLAVLLVFGFLFGNVPVVQAETGEWTTEAPPLSDLVGRWDGHVRLLFYDLGPSPTPPPPGEKATCDPQIYASAVAGFEDMKAQGSIAAALTISSTGPEAGTLELDVHYSPKGTSSPASSTPMSMPFRFQDGSLSAQVEQSGIQVRLSAWATQTTYFVMGLVDSSFITIAGNLKVADPKTGKVIVYYSFVTGQEGVQVDRGEPLGYSLNLAPGTDARTVEFLPYDGEEWQPVPESGFALRAGDRLRTKDPNKIVSIKLTAGESTLCGTRIARGTISFGKVVDNQKYKTTKILLESNPGGIGGILAPAGLAIDILTNDVANPPRVEVRTQNAVITVLGTAAVIEEIENETSVKVLEGAVQTIAYGNGASQVLAAGQAITGNEQGFSAIASFDMAAELAKWGPLEGIVASPSASIQPSSEVPTGISPTATALPTPQPTSSGIFLGLSTQWWIVIGAGLGLLLLAILVLVLILRSGRRQRRVPFAYSVPPIPGPVAIHCRACGTALPGGQRFCGSCGADSLMTVASPVAPMIVPLIVPAGNVCPVCSRLMNPGDRFCQGCGSALPGGPT